MNLTPAQLTTLKTHLLANTNVVTPSDNGTTPPFAVNSRLNGADTDPTIAGFIANLFYNQPAKNTDNQPFTNLVVWNTFLHDGLIATVAPWQQPPQGFGTTDAQVGNAIAYWAALTKRPLNMADSQTRRGLVQVWGTGATGGAAFAAVGGAWLNGRNIELVFGDALAGGNSPWGTGAVKVALDANGLSLNSQILNATGIAQYQQICTGQDILNAMTNG